MSNQRRLIMLWVITAAALVAAFFHHPLVILCLIIIAMPYQLALPRPQLSLRLQLLVLVTVLCALGAACTGPFPILQAALWIASGIMFVCLAVMSIAWEVRLFRSSSANKPSA
jgi:hypothetical protein